MKPFAARLSVLFVAAFVAALAGCESTTQRAPANEVVRPPETPLTESDEPEIRKRARLRIELASNYFEQGQTTVALDEVKQAINTDPSYPEAYNLRGLIFMRLNDPRQAEESFRRALALNPRDPNSMHNFGWLLCQQARYPESFGQFMAALGSPVYQDRGKSLMALGVCQARAGRKIDAETTLARAYEADPGNPIVGYNLAQLLFQRGDFTKSQFYIRRLNNSEQANAETLWLGVKVERRLEDRVAMQQLGEQLRKRFPQSREARSYERGAFDE